MKIAAKHLKAINELLNSEACALAAFERHTDPEKKAWWAYHGFLAAKELEIVYGIVSSAGSLDYWFALCRLHPKTV